MNQEIVVDPQSKPYPYCTDVEALRKPCEPVDMSKFHFNESETVKKLKELFSPIDQLGLAANQVFCKDRIFIAKIRNDTYWFVNPRILQQSSESAPSVEGCVSMPGQSWCLDRFVWIEVEADMVLTESGKQYLSPMRIRDLDAAVFQHELDHLNGILIVDHPKVLTREERVAVKRQKRDQRISKNKYMKKMAKV